MRTSHAFLVTILLAAGVLWLGAERSSAQDRSHAAVVVRYDDDHVISRCVAFEEQITGYEALRQGGFTVDAGFNVQGGRVCRIDDTGCPADDCFCQCEGGDECVYWSYWHQVDGSWEYAAVGASTYLVSDGGVEGWSWGPGTITLAVEPPQLDFDEVCSETIRENMAIAGSDLKEEKTPTANWRQYGIFGGILSILLLVAIYLRIRRSSS